MNMKVKQSVLTSCAASSGAFYRQRATEETKSQRENYGVSKKTKENN